MDKEEEYWARVIIAADFVEIIRKKYSVTAWGIDGSTARKEMLPEADLDIFISLDIPAEERQKHWQEMGKWVEPIIEQFHDEYGILIDLNW